MNAALEWSDETLIHRDGFNEATNRFEPLNIKMQNAATTKFLKVPAFGQIYGTNTNRVRTEPVALGGAHGKGFFTHSNQGIRYAIPQQTRTGLTLENKDWYVSFYLDPRFEDVDVERNVLQFPDGDRINLI